MPATDVHRHLCTPRLFETLACRTSEPRLRREGSANADRLFLETA